MDQQSYHRELDLACSNFFAKILRRASYHLPGQENADDQEQEQVDHSDAFAAINAVEPHAPEGRERGDRIQAVMLAVYRTAGYIHCGRGKGCTGRGSEAQLFALEIAEMLIDWQSRDGRQSNQLFSIRRAWVRNRECSAIRMCSQTRIRLHGVIVDCPRNCADE